MRLTELNARFFAEPGRRGQGVIFLCPCCKRSELAVAFANPLDGGAVMPIHGGPRHLWAVLNPEQKRTEIVPPGIHWQRFGEDLESLTIAPSVDASPAGHWHGFVRDGAIS